MPRRRARSTRVGCATPSHLLKGYDCFIGTNVEYAPYVEEGTSRMKGKHFLRKAATGHGDTYRAILEKYLRGGA